MDFLTAATLFFVLIFVVGLTLLFHYELHLISIAEVLIGSISSLTFIVFVGYYYIFQSQKLNLESLKDRTKDSLRFMKGLRRTEGNPWRIGTQILRRVISIVVQAIPIFSASAQRFLESERVKDKLLSFKQDVLDCLERYSISSIELKQNMEDPEALSILSTDWLKDAANIVHSSCLVGKDPIPAELTKLFYYEHLHSQKLDHQWQTILDESSRRILQTLSRIYIANNLVESSVVDHELSLPLMENLLSNTKRSYSKEDIVRLYNRTCTELRDVSENIDRMSKYYELSFTSNILLPSVLSSSFDSIESTLIKRASEISGIDKEILFLVYFILNDVTRANELFLRIRDTPEMLHVLEFMLEREILKSDLPSSSLLEIVRKFDSLNIVKWQSTVDRAHDAISFANAMLKFLSDFKVRTNSEAGLMPHVLQLIKPKITIGADSDMPSVLAAVTRRLVNWDDLPGMPDRNKEENIEKFSQMLTVVFVNRRGSPYEMACYSKATEKWKIDVNLYYLIKLKEENPASELGSLILQALAFKAIAENDAVLFSEFQFRLHGRQFIYDFSTLMGLRFDTSLKVERSTLKIQKLEMFRTNVQNFLRKQLDLKNVKDLTLGRVIQAYLITVPVELRGGKKRAAVMDALNDIPGLQSVVNQLDLKYNTKRYKDIILPIPGSGWNTRIGVVPQDMAYSECSSLLEDILRMHFKNKGETQQLFMTKISATEESFKVLIKEAQTQVDLFDKIREIVRKRFSAYYQVALYVSTNEMSIKESTILDVVGRIIDTEAGGFMNLLSTKERQTLIKTLGKDSGSLMDAITQNLNVQLSTGNFHSLCIALAKSVNVAGQNASSAIVKRALSHVCSDKIVKQKDLDNLSQLIVGVAEMVGDIFQ